MKLTVFGASGGTGTQVVSQALAAGHEVLAVVRDPARLAVPSRAGLDVAVADVMDPGSIRDLVAGREAVISAVGPSRRKEERKASAQVQVCTASARSITAAMAAAGSRRLVVVSASGPFTDGDGPLLRYLAKPIVNRVLEGAFTDFLAMEQVVRASGLDWTILRPPRLTRKPLTGRYRTRRGTNVRRGLTVSRADLAHLVLAVCGDPDTYRAAIAIAN
ncbi:MAG TPA: NAD(P)-binding oxidoreductase [Streptosporangiaceae bacterium]|nr:NAD(P)-binding oxidoreductase [Streptosporangiaceae bacterium]